MEEQILTYANWFLSIALVIFQSIDWLIDWLTNCFLMDWSIDWLIESSSYWSFWLIDWLIVFQWIDWLIDWVIKLLIILIDWLICNWSLVAVLSHRNFSSAPPPKQRSSSPEKQRLKKPCSDGSALGQMQPSLAERILALKKPSSAPAVMVSPGISASTAVADVLPSTPSCSNREAEPPLHVQKLQKKASQAGSGVKRVGPLLCWSQAPYVNPFPLKSYFISSRNFSISHLIKSPPTSFLAVEIDVILKIFQSHSSSCPVRHLLFEHIFFIFFSFLKKIKFFSKSFFGFCFLFFGFLFFFWFFFNENCIVRRNPFDEADFVEQADDSGHVEPSDNAPPPACGNGKRAASVVDLADDEESEIVVAPPVAPKVQDLI